MKRSIAFALTLAALPSLAAAGDCPEVSTPTVCGHRGTGANAPGNPLPENTLPSFQQASAEGATMVELDVMHAADGALVVIHDETVDRTTDGTGCVGDLTLGQLSALDAGVGTALEGTAVTIPTLALVLDTVDVAVNVEIKLPDSAGCPDPDRGLLAADVVDLIHAHPDRPIVVSSFDMEVLTTVHALDPDVYVGLVTLDPIADMEVAHSAGLSAIHPIFVGATPEIVEAAHALGLQVAPWTVDDVTFLTMMVDAGVDTIITNEPDVLVGLLAERSAAPCVVDPPVEQPDAGSYDASAADDASAAGDAGDAGGGGQAGDAKGDAEAPDLGHIDRRAGGDALAAGTDVSSAGGDPASDTSVGAPGSGGAGGSADQGCAAARGDSLGPFGALWLLFLAACWTRRRAHR